MDEIEHRTQHYLTTVDNPYNPFNEDEWMQWYKYDELNGHCCCRMMATALTSYEFSDLDNSLAIEERIDQVVSRQSYKVNPITQEFEKIYIKVTPDYYKKSGASQS